MLSWFPGMPSGGGGYFHILRTGYAAGALITSPTSIKAKPEKHTYSYNFT